MAVMWGSGLIASMSYGTMLALKLQGSLAMIYNRDNSTNDFM